MRPGLKIKYISAVGINVDILPLSPLLQLFDAIKIDLLAVRYFYPLLTGF